MGDGSGTFVIRSPGCIRFVPESEILWVEAVRHYVRLHLDSDTALYRCAMRDLESQLSDRFIRIHRSYFVRADLVRRLMKRKNGRYEVFLAGGKALPVGDTYLPSTRDRLGV